MEFEFPQYQNGSPSLVAWIGSGPLVGRYESPPLISLSSDASEHWKCWNMNTAISRTNCTNYFKLNSNVLWQLE
ncbi:hypothetical protein P8452_35297 [Trifolium repens]|nr:hypothetical protein P8452_35297 [Trifolium repens]